MESKDATISVDNGAITALLKRQFISQENIQKIAILFEISVDEIYDFIMTKCYVPKFVEAVDRVAQTPEMEGLMTWLDKTKVRFFLNPSGGPRQAQEFVERADTLGGFLWMARYMNGFSMEEIGKYSHLRRQDIIAIEKNDMPYLVERELILFS